MTVTRVLIAAIVAVSAATAFAATQEGTPVTGPRKTLIEDDIMPKVANLRGLEYLHDVPVRSVSKDDVEKYIRSAIAEETTDEEFSGYEKILAYLGLIPAGMDLKETLIQAYRENIAGYYDDREKAFFVVQGSSSQALDNVTIAHELVHALQDQHFDLSSFDDITRHDDDAALGVMGLAEGDATDIMWRYATGYAPRGEGPVPEYATVTSISLGPESMPGMPMIIMQNMLFPYTYGTRFVETLLTKAGPEAVDYAFRNPPISSEQLIDPQKYIDYDEPYVIELPDFTSGLPSGWKLLDAEPIGQFNLGLYLSVHTGTWGVDKAVEGWDGDIMAAYGGPGKDDFFVAHYSVWDTQQDAVEYMDRYRRLIDMRFPNLKRAYEDDRMTSWTGDGLVYYLARKGNDVLGVEHIPQSLASVAILGGWDAKKTPFGVAHPIGRKLSDAAKRDEVGAGAPGE